MKKSILILLLMCSLCGCSTRISGLTLISDRNINTNGVNVSNLPATRNVVGKSSKFVFLFIPFGIPTIKEALEDALNKADGDLMIDASLYKNNWWFLIGKTELELRGTVVNTKKGARRW